VADTQYSPNQHPQWIVNLENPEESRQEPG